MARLGSYRIILKVDGDDNLEVVSAVIKEASDDSSLKAYYEKEMSVNSGDRAALKALFDQIKAQLKSEDDLD